MYPEKPLLGRKIEVTRFRVHPIPVQRHGVESDSDQEESDRVGSDSIAALSARRESPSGFKDEAREVKKMKK